jgi:hypothetical protein
LNTSGADPARGSVGIAFDGKAQRGRLACADRPEYPVHMLGAVLHDCGIALAQVPLEHTGEEAVAELTAAPSLVARLDLRAYAFSLMGIPSKASAAWTSPL